MFSDNYPVNNYYPTVSAIEVVATQPTEADFRTIKYMQSTGNFQVGNATYIVKLNLDNIPEISSLGFLVYVGEFRVRKYSECKDGIYFKIYEPQFFSEHAGQNIRFSIDGTIFQDSGQHLPTVDDMSSLTLAESEVNPLPTQEQVLGW